MRTVAMYIIGMTMGIAANMLNDGGFKRVFTFFSLFLAYFLIGMVVGATM